MILERRTWSAQRFAHSCAPIVSGIVSLDTQELSLLMSKGITPMVILGGLPLIALGMG